MHGKGDVTLRFDFKNVKKLIRTTFRIKRQKQNKNNFEHSDLSDLKPDLVVKNSWIRICKKWLRIQSPEGRHGTVYPTFWRGTGGACTSPPPSSRACSPAPSPPPAHTHQSATQQNSNKLARYSYSRQQNCMKKKKQWCRSATSLGSSGSPRSRLRPNWVGSGLRQKNAAPGGSGSIH